MVFNWGWAFATQERDKYAKKMTMEEINEAQRMAAEWLEMNPPKE